MKSANTQIRTSISPARFNTYEKSRARASQQRSEFIAEGAKIMTGWIRRFFVNAAGAVATRSRLFFKTA